MSITNQTASASLITAEPYVPPTVMRVYMYRMYPDRPISGEITFAGKLGEVKLKLNDESCSAILALLADAASKSISEVADALRSQFAALTPPADAAGGDGGAR